MTVFDRIRGLKEFEHITDEQINQTIEDTTLFLDEFYTIPLNLLDTAKYYYTCYLLSNFGSMKLKSVSLTEVSETYDITTVDWLSVFDNLFGSYKKDTVALKNQNSFTVLI